MLLYFHVAGGKGPMVREHLHDVYARPGGIAEFQCRVAGEPAPKISWQVFSPPDLLIIVISFHFTIDYLHLFYFIRVYCFIERLSNKISLFQLLG